MTFKVGDRVIISKEYHWAKGAPGTIGEPPDIAVEIGREYSPWDGCHHFVQGVKGPIEFHWVVFDEPHDDGSGDGPYREAEIETSMLKLL